MKKDYLKRYLILTKLKNLTLSYCYIILKIFKITINFETKKLIIYFTSRLGTRIARYIYSN